MCGERVSIGGRVLQPDKSMEAELAVGFRLFRERYTSKVTLQRPELVRAEAVNTQLFETLITEWRLQPGPQPATTWVDFQVEFAFKSALYAHAAGMFLDEVGRRMVTAFEEQCRREYGIQPQIPQPPSACSTTDHPLRPPESPNPEPSVAVPDTSVNETGQGAQADAPGQGVQADAPGQGVQADAPGQGVQADAPARRQSPSMGISSKLSVTRPARTKPPPPLPDTGRGLW
jgi:ribosome-associated toxin RatA of RatAB toxin-antitoxin module